MNRAMIMPSVMCMSAWDGLKELDELEQIGADYLHVDVMDGEFVPNLMLGINAIRELRRRSSIPRDIHLMIERPEEKLSWFDPQPGEFVSVHVESTKHLHRAITRIRECGARPMVALNPLTPLVMIEEALPYVEAVLVMAVNPGFAGQKMVPQTLGKIARLRRLLDENGLRDVRIEVDGNVSFENGAKMRGAGADMFVCGTSSLFAKVGTVEENIRRFRKALDAADNLIE